MVLLTIIIVLYLVAQIAVLAFVYGWAVQADVHDEASHAAQIVLVYNREAKTRNDRMNENRKKLTREVRLIMVDYYNRSKFEKWRRRNFGETKEMRERLARVKDLQQALKSDETHLNRYHVLVRGELHRIEDQMPELVDHLRNMMS